jgi:hypothetical protein
MPINTSRRPFWPCHIRARTSGQQRCFTVTHRGDRPLLNGEPAGDGQARDDLLSNRSCLSRALVEDFKVNLNAARRPIDSYAMWGAANLIMDGLCSAGGFWYFQPWLIGQGRQRYDLAAWDPDNLADVPAVRVLAGRRPGQWTDAEWPQWEELAYVAISAHERITGQETASMRRWPHAVSRAPPALALPDAPGTSIASQKSSNACHGSRTCSPASNISRLELSARRKPRQYAGLLAAGKHPSLVALAHLAPDVRVDSASKPRRAINIGKQRSCRFDPGRPLL